MLVVQRIRRGRLADVFGDARVTRTLAFRFHRCLLRDRRFDERANTMNAEFEVLLGDVCSITDEKRKRLARFDQRPSVVCREFLVQVDLVLIQDRLLITNRF